MNISLKIYFYVTERLHFNWGIFRFQGYEICISLLFFSLNNLHTTRQSEIYHLLMISIKWLYFFYFWKTLVKYSGPSLEPLFMHACIILTFINPLSQTLYPDTMMSKGLPFLNLWDEMLGKYWIGHRCDPHFQRYKKVPCT